MGILFSFRRENTQPANSTPNNSTETNNNTTNIPNSRLNLIYNQISSNKNKKKNYNVSFSAHFFIAGKKFKNGVGNLMNQAQTFLFGDQLDLNFILANKPVLFPHVVPSLDAPSKYLQSLVNIRKDTIKLIKCNTYSNTEELTKYNIEFKFDCDCDVKIRIRYFSVEKFVPNQESSNINQLVYSCGCTKFANCFCLIKDENNEPIVYRKGANILFQRPEHFIIPDNFHMSNWQFNLNSNYYPIVIECRPLNEKLEMHHAHVTLAYIDKISSHVNKTQLDSNINNNSVYSLQSNLKNSYYYQIKPIKQKQFIDGVLYSLQEIYGIEKKNSNDYDTALVANDLCDSQTSSSIATSLTATTATNSNSTTTSSTRVSSKRINQDEISLDSTFKEDDMDEKKRKIEEEIEQELKGIECVICMCETRDTLILPCRHLCLCKLCAINLRIQSNNCPICRIPFIALLQIKLLRRKGSEKQIKPVAFDMNQLPVLKIENLNILFNEDNLIISENLPNSKNDTEIIEETHHIKSENDNDNFIKKEILVSNENKRPRLLDLYETVTIYEAFNESGIQAFKNNENKPTKKTKKSKINKQTSLPIDTLNQTEQPEQSVCISEQKINALNTTTLKMNNESFGLKINENTLPFQARSSSVLVGRIQHPKSIRSASYVGNYNSNQQQSQETIQMGDI